MQQQQRHRQQQQQQQQAWTTSNDEADIDVLRQSHNVDQAGGGVVKSRTSGVGGHCNVGTHTGPHYVSSGSRGRAKADAAMTTSEDDAAVHGDDDEAELRLHRRPSFPTNTSTLDSSHIDRAKSFEYFPGESFPLQENSSSYEYLPGHMVDDRPGIIVILSVIKNQVLK